MHSSPYSPIALDRTLLRIVVGIISFLFVANALLVPLGSAPESLASPLRYVIHQVDLNEEGNFATWCSSMLLLLNAFSAYLLARGRWATNRRVALTTALMAVGFLLLSIDDFIGLHEFLEEVMAQALSHHDARDTSTVMALGPLFGIALASLLTVLVAGAYWRAVQRENLPLLIACVGCVLTVGLAEFVYYQAGCLEHWCFRLEVLVEEGSELAAILLFLTFQSQELVALENPPLLA